MPFIFNLDIVNLLIGLSETYAILYLRVFCLFIDKIFEQLVMSESCNKKSKPRLPSHSIYP